MARKAVKESHKAGPAGICFCFCLMILWLLMLPILLLSHVAIGKVYPELQDLPDNVDKGFNAVLKFGMLEADSKIVKDQASLALGKCSVTTALCNNLPTTDVTTPDTSAEYNKITAAFTNSLNMISKVCNDPLFGTASMAATATKLQTMIADMDAMKTKVTGTPCSGVTPTYCQLYTNADSIITNIAPVKKQISDFTNSDIVKTFKDYSDNLKFMHALPYLIIAAMVFLSLMWCTDVGCLCCSCCGNPVNLLFSCAIWLFWTLFFVFYFLVWVIGYAIREKAEDIEINGILKTNTNLKALLTHIETNYPEFWSVVIADLADALGTLYGASFFAVVISLILPIYAILLCIVRPYHEKE